MPQTKSNLPYYIWKLSNKLYLRKIPVFPFLIQQILRFFFCCLIPYQTRIGKNVHFAHMGMGIVIHPLSVIGNGVTIFQHVTIGGRSNTGLPIIGDNVEIGAGAAVLGGIKIGRDAKIGANAVVISDIPEGCTALGVPARIIEAKKREIRSFDIDLTD